MNNYTLLLTLYNDWDSFKILIHKINDNLKKNNKKAEIFIINDFSKKIEVIESLSNIKKIEIINLKKNFGSQKALSIGLQHLKKLEDERVIVVMDSDGEDDPDKISDMLNAAESNTNNVIVSCRTKRRESSTFRVLYFFHKLITFIFTLEWISYGNYSSFHSKNLAKILKDDSSWLALSTCIKKNCNILRLYAARNKRLFGNSKLSIRSLIIHSLRINCVFLKRIIIISFIYSFIVSYLVNVALVVPIVIYNLILILIFLGNNQKEFRNALINIKSKSIF